jgi:hypothetical protein
MNLVCRNLFLHSPVRVAWPRSGVIAADLEPAGRHQGRDPGSCWWSPLSWRAEYAPARRQSAPSPLTKMHGLVSALSAECMDAVLRYRDYM